jgi:hypothetical protein
MSLAREVTKFTRCLVPSCRHTHVHGEHKCSVANGRRQRAQFFCKKKKSDSDSIFFIIFVFVSNAIARKVEKKKVIISGDSAVVVISWVLFVGL